MQTDPSLLTAGVQVWVPHATEGFRAASIVEEVPKKGFKVSIDGEEPPVEEVYPHTDIWLRNPAILEGVDDLTKLSYMHEAAILHNLHVRYMINQVYTFTGPILIAVNPYQRLPIYSKQMITQYCGQPLGKLSPHVYAIAEDAFRAMLTERRSQSILVSGESGAGKTETAKFLLQYFAAMGEENKGEGNVHNQVLESTPLLEAFGNAKTLRNDNSSRFGKFIGIQFDRNGNISGASIQTYLLEKSRIVRQMNGERNYHIFYQLLAGATEEEKQQCKLTSVADYFYINQSDCCSIEGVSDEKIFRHTKKALSIAGIGDDLQASLWKVIAAVLHLGNWKKGIDAPLQATCELLEVDFAGIKSSLTQRKVVAAREVYIVDMDDEQAEGARDALAMLLYSRLFDWLVMAVNENLQKSKKPGSTDEAFIGVLDIYGFESFDVNSFEQFCINYANEKLQQQFNQHMFKVEQQEYIKEKLDWSYINFNDNQECLDLIEKKPLGILSLLDEECRFPKSSPKSLALKLKQNHIKSKYFKSDPRQSENSFVIHHYAGSVSYDTTYFLDKNKDFIIEDQVKVLLDSQSPFVRGLFAPKAQPSPAASPAAGGRGGQSATAVKFVSVASQFRDSLSELMSTIEKTTPHYVRCIKPNPQKRPGIFEKPKVLEQLRCGGVLESVRVCMAGYPGRHIYEQFYKRYRLLEPSAGADATEAQAATKGLVAALKLGEGQYQFGLTKLFLKGGLIAILERRRGEKLHEAALKIQKTWRCYGAKKLFRRMMHALVKMQCCMRMILAKKRLLELRRQRAATNIQKAVRAWRARTQYKKQRECLIYIQRVFKAKREKRILRAIRREKAATTIQSAIRGKLQRKRYQKARRQIILVQGLWRVRKAKEVLQKLRRKAQALSKVVAAKAALEKKVEEMEIRYAAESKIKKKVEKENARLKKELDEMKKTIAQMKSLEEKREKELEESALRREKEGRDKHREREREMEELKGKLREEAEARASAADELEKAKAELKIIRTRAENAERDRDSAQAEIASLRERLTQLESREDEKERTIASLQREAEKIRIRAPKKKMEGEKMERLQDRKTDYTSTKSLREGADHIPASPPLATRSRTPSTEEDKRVTRMERSLSIGSGVDKPRVEKEPSVPEGELPKEKGRAIRRKTAAPSVHRQTQRSAEQPGAKDSGVGADSDAENESESEASPAVEETAREMRPSLTKQELPPKSKVEAAHPAITGTPSAVAVVQEELVYPPTQQAEESPSDAKEPHPESHEEQQAPQKKTEEMAEEEDYYIDSRHLTDKHKKRRDVEREIVDRLRQKYEGKNTLVGLENEAIMTLLSDSRDVTSRNFLRFLLCELEPGFVSGVPVPSFVIYCFLCFWNLLSEKEPQTEGGEAKPDDTLGFIIESIYDGAKANYEDNDLLTYWLSVASSLCHLVDQKLHQRPQSDDDDDEGVVLPEETFFVMESLDDLEDEEATFTLSSKQRAEVRSSSFNGHQFKQHLWELVRRLYIILLKRIHVTLDQMLNEIVLGKDWTSPSPFRSRAIKASSSDSITGVLSKYLLSLVQNFIYLSLVQKFFSQVFWFINTILFNEVLLCTQFCSINKAMDLKMHLSNIDKWISEEGGLWLENTQTQMAQLEQLITLLMINKKLIVSSEQLRKEAIPKLNIMQIKQVLAMYMPTDLEERISLTDIQKLDKAARDRSEDDNLLLESNKLFPLSSKDLHYLELEDANNIPFPFEIKQKIHDIVEQDILKRMTVATKVQQVREKKSRISLLLPTNLTVRLSKKSDADETADAASAVSSGASDSLSSPSSPRTGLSLFQRLTGSTVDLPKPSSRSAGGSTNPAASPMAWLSGVTSTPRDHSSTATATATSTKPIPSPSSSSSLSSSSSSISLGHVTSAAPPSAAPSSAPPASDEDVQKATGIRRVTAMRKPHEGKEDVERRELQDKEKDERQQLDALLRASSPQIVIARHAPSGKEDEDSSSTSSGDDDDDDADIIFDEEEDKKESEKQTKAALSAVVKKEGRSGSFWSSFFK